MFGLLAASNGVLPWPDNADSDSESEISLVKSAEATLPDYARYYDASLMNPKILVGIFIGCMATFVFCALTMNAVGRAAYRMMNECRRQFEIMRGQFKKDGMTKKNLADPTKWPTKVEVDGHMFPDYAECVAISTAGAQREMVIPSLLAIAAPVAVGLILGVGGVMGLLMLARQ